MSIPDAKQPPQPLPAAAAAATPTAPAWAPAPALSSALATARALVLLQLLSRLLTFGLNQALVRLAPPSVFGTAAIQFDLVASTILFLSREGVRTALLRRKSKSTETGRGGGTDGTDPSGAFSPSDAILAATPSRLGVAVAAGAVSLYLYTAPGSTTSQPRFHGALGCYVLGALLELLVEPLYLRSLRSDPPRLKVRVQAEGGMAIVRAVVTFACLVLDSGNNGEAALMGFAAGYLAGAAWLAARYIAEYGGFGRRQGVVRDLMLPEGKYKDKDDEDADADSEETRQLAWSNTRQSVVKHVLTEADRLVVGYISPLGDQGGYAVAINYGSLVARIIFQPLEETLLLLWSSGSPASALPVLTIALRLSAHLALLFPVFLPPLLPAILPLLLPRRYTSETSAAQTLTTYLTAYLPILSLNGISEAFVAATASPAQVARQARFMFVSSGTFAAALFVLTRGLLPVQITTEQALIFSSCAAMLVRIGFALAHAAGVARTTGSSAFGLAKITPKLPVVVATALAGAPVWLAARRVDTDVLAGKAGLVGVGGLCGVVVLAVIYMCEKDEFRQFQMKRSKTE